MILNILNEINKARGKAKQDIMNSYKDNELFKKVCFMTYNNKMTFGINKKTFPERQDGFGNNLCLDDALKELETNFATRVVSGGAAVLSLKGILSNLSESDSEVIRRVMMRDLDVGINVSTINKVWPKLIKEQPQMLASPEDQKLIDKILKNGNAFAEMKADGARGFGDISQNQVNFFSRSGKEYTGLTRITNAILASGWGNWVVDGEFVVRESKKHIEVDIMASLMGEIEESSDVDPTKKVFDRESGNGIMNKSLQGTITDEESDDIVYQVWDIVPRGVYYGDDKSTMTQEQRREMLIKFVNSVDDDCIEVIESTPVKTMEDVRRVYQGYVKNGFEGIILKDGNSVWEDRRSKSYVKFKEKYPFDLEIVDVYAHEKDPNKVGGFTMVSSCGTIKTDGGSGLTDTTHRKVYEGKFDWDCFQHMYEHHEDKAGKFIEILIPIEDRGDLDREKLMLMHKAGKLVSMIVECEVNAPTTSKTRKAGEPEFSFFLPIIKKLRYDKSVANRYEDVFVIKGE